MQTKASDSLIKPLVLLLAECIRRNLRPHRILKTNMKLCIFQYPVAKGAVASNLLEIEKGIEYASREKADLLCLPEMCTTGFDWRHMDSILPHAEESILRIQSLAKASQIAICGSFLSKQNSNKPTNTFYYIEADGTIAVRYNKIHLFKPFKEDLYLDAGDAIVSAPTQLGTIGCSICYDLRFPEIFRGCALAGAEIQILPAAFPDPKLETWRTLVRARAIENQNFVIAINQTSDAYTLKAGEEDTFFGHSMVVNPSGEVLFEAGTKRSMDMVAIDLSEVQKARSGLPSLQDRRTDLY